MLSHRGFVFIHLTKISFRTNHGLAVWEREEKSSTPILIAGGRFLSPFEMTSRVAYLIHQIKTLLQPDIVGRTTNKQVKLTGLCDPL